MVSVGASVGRSGEGRPTDPDFSHKTDRQRNKSWVRPCAISSRCGHSVVMGECDGRILCLHFVPRAMIIIRCYKYQLKI